MTTTTMSVSNGFVSTKVNFVDDGDSVSLRVFLPLDVLSHCMRLASNDDSDVDAR